MNSKRKKIMSYKSERFSYYMFLIYLILIYLTRTNESSGNPVNATALINFITSIIDTTQTIDHTTTIIDTTQTIDNTTIIIDTTQTIDNTTIIIDTTQTIDNTTIIINNTQTIDNTTIITHTTQTIDNNTAIIYTTQTIDHNNYNNNTAHNIDFFTDIIDTNQNIDNTTEFNNCTNSNKCFNYTNEFSNITSNSEYINNYTEFTSKTNDNTESIVYKTEDIIYNTEYINYNYNYNICNSNEDEVGSDNCNINIMPIINNLSYSIITKLTSQYVNSTNNSSQVSLYINDDNNYTITIFNNELSTNFLIRLGKFGINTDKITNEIKNNLNLNDSNNFIISYTNYNYKSYIEIYDEETGQLIDLKTICPKCYEESWLKITNNYTEELLNILGDAMTNKISENNLNIFDKENPIFNDICHNFTIEGIDVPLKERRRILFVGNQDKQIICDHINCQVENIFLSNLTGICNCNVSFDINELFSESDQTSNDKSQEEYNSFINSPNNINSFLIFKCPKESFKNNNIKNNPGIYISPIFIGIQIVLFCFYIFYKPKNMRVKELLNLHPPKKNNIAEEDEEKEKNSIIINNPKDSIKDNQKNDEIVIYKDEIVNNNGFEIGKNINNTEKTFKDNDIFDTKINSNIQDKIINPFDPIINIQKKDVNPIKTDNSNEKLNIGDEKENILKIKKNSRSIHNMDNNNNLNTENKFIDEEKNNDYENNQKISDNQANNTKEDKDKNESFLYSYWRLVQLKQPIINLLSSIKCLKLEESYIPFLIKLMRFIFILSLNVFFNALHLDQEYFRKKYEYFNKKYNLRYAYLNKSISSNEKFSYGFSYSITSALISFVICFIIQSILNYFFFNMKRIVEQIKSINNNRTNNINNKDEHKNDQENNISLIIKSFRKSYIIIFSISIFLMFIIFYSVINFNQIYKGGAVDCFSGAFWTFIFLQIIPFIYCLIFAFCKYKGNKSNNKKMYNFGNYIYF